MFKSAAPLDRCACACKWRSFGETANRLVWGRCVVVMYYGREQEQNSTTFEDEKTAPFRRHHQKLLSRPKWPNRSSFYLSALLVVFRCTPGTVKNMTSFTINTCKCLFGKTCSLRLRNSHTNWLLLCLRRLSESIEGSQRTLSRFLKQRPIFSILMAHPLPLQFC